jgi:outer membrane protein insertion porin family/translocation and assembly module TamA
MLSLRRVIPLVLAAAAYSGAATGWAQNGNSPTQEVRSVSFQGNNALDSRTLSTSIATSGYIRPFYLRWLGKGTAPPFNEREFRRDVLRIKAMYGVHGFPDARVDTTVIRQGNDVRVTFRISEGSPINVDSVVVRGLPEKVSPESVQRELPLRTGEPFDRLLFATSVTTVEAILHNAGYAFAKVTGGYQASSDAQSVTVQLDAEPGPRAVISRVDIQGNQSVDRRAIMKALSIYPGELYSYKAIHQSEIDLYRSQMFRQVQIKIEDSATHNPRDTLVDVQANVRLTEYPLQRARLSAGYGTLDCFRTMGSMDLFNFTGGGRRLEIRAGASKIGVSSPVDLGLQNSLCPALINEDPIRLEVNYNLSVTMHEPLLFSRHSMGTATVFTERHSEYHAFLREALGTELAVTRQFAEDLAGRISYNLSSGRTLATAVTFCALLSVCNSMDTQLFTQRRLRSVWELELTRDRTNSRLDPTRGTAASFQVRWSPSFLGSDSLMQFTKFLFKVQSHREMTPKNILSTRFEIGTILTHTVNFSGGAVNYAPPEERFYLGGANTVRGYPANQVGPVVWVQPDVGNAIVSAIGGSFMLLGSIEDRFLIPGIIKGLWGAIFVDAGQISQRTRASLSDVKVTPGIGLRLQSVLGPIRLDIGFNPYPLATAALYTQQGENLILVDPNYRPNKNWYDYFRFNFSIGQAF